MPKRYNKPHKKNSKPASGQQAIRLNRYIASTGMCSRREADQYIVAGLVSVNGKVLNKLGEKVLPTDVVKFNGKILKDQKKVYILMNKHLNKD